LPAGTTRADEDVDRRRRRKITATGWMTSCMAPCREVGPTLKKVEYKNTQSLVGLGYVFR